MPQPQIKRRIPKLRVSKGSKKFYPMGNEVVLAKRKAKLISTGWELNKINSAAHKSGGIMTPSGIINAHAEQAQINKRLGEGNPTTVLAELQETWKRPFRGGGVGWGIEGKRIRMKPKQAIPRNLVAKGIAHAFNTNIYRKMPSTGNQVSDWVAQTARKILWETPIKGPTIKNPLTKEELMRKTIKQLESNGFELGPSKK